MQVTKEGILFIGRAASHYVILLFCETLLHVLLGICCKRFYWIPLFTIPLLFCMFEIGKAKSVTESVLMILTLNGLFQKNFQVFYFTPENSFSLTLPLSPSVSLFSIIVLLLYFLTAIIHPFDKSTFTHTVSQEYIIAIENTYLNGVFLKSKISIFP